MRQIVVEARAEGPAAVTELLPLLDEPTSAAWLAFQLLELCHLSEAESRMCLSVVERLAEGDSMEALAARMWLREHRVGPDHP